MFRGSIASDLPQRLPFSFVFPVSIRARPPAMPIPAIPIFPFAQALHEADGRADEIEFGAKLIFQKALEAEMQRLLLIGEQEKGRRSGLGLSEIVDTHRTRLGRSAPLQIDIFLEPAI